MKPTSLLNRRLQLALGAAIVASLVVPAISYRSIIVSSESNRWVRHTHEVLENLQNLVKAVWGIEASYRGFALTGEESYLESYRASIMSAARDEATIQTLTADNRKQELLIATVQGLAAQKIQFGERVIGLRRTTGLQAAADAIRSGTGEKLRREFQGVVRQMQDEELRLLVLRDADAKRRLGQTKTILILGTVLGLVIAAAAVWSVKRNNSQRGHAEKALQDSEEKYRLLLDGVQDHAIFMLDPQGRVASWNSGAERIKGYRADEIIGQDFSRFYIQDEIDQGRPKAELQIAIDSGRSEVEHWRVRKDGSRFWASVVITAVRDSSGGLLGFSEISRDISERRETEAKYRGLLEAAPDAMVVVNQDGEIVLLNLQAEKRFGYHRDELVGQKVKNIIPEGFAERLIADGIRTAAEALAQQIGTGIELYGRRKDGSEFPIEIMLSPLESAEGILVTAAIRDISVRKVAEKHLAEIVGELKRSNDELGQFAYVASHDLQEPLRMVASYTQLLAKRYKGRLDSDADEFIEYAVDGSNRMQKLILDLLTYSRAGAVGKVFREISSESALEEALTNLRATIRESGAVVTHDALPAVTTDDTQLMQLFQNLVGNAIKYRSADVPRVHISAAKNGCREWVFSVRDNGQGIDPQYFERIFILFQRLHGQKNFKGTGIGLAICKKILDRLGGRIWVESQLKIGSIFYFALPEGGK
ncbi:MAG TPA: PAS domain S-box protein [Candidatus Saccharimonadales bacterium]|nr:PAS domain S-box protein [Candidatus Saccharimonadales bacterium]